MSWFCLRVDLDFVPWESQDAAFVAQLLRLWTRARERGWRLHHFVSARCLLALPSLADGALNEGHDLDWLVHDPERASAEWAAAEPLFKRLGHRPVWVAGADGFGELKPVGAENVWSVDLGDLDGLTEAVSAALGSGLRMATLRTQPETS